MTTTDDTFMTLTEVAELARTTPGAIYQWRRRGKGPRARRVGKQLLFRRSDVLAWIDAQPDHANGVADIRYQADTEPLGPRPRRPRTERLDPAA
jgi:excisionase family DNA binding protein